MYSIDDLDFINDLIDRTAYLAQYANVMRLEEKQMADATLLYLSELRKYREFMVARMEAA